MLNPFVLFVCGREVVLTCGKIAAGFRVFIALQISILQLASEYIGIWLTQHFFFFFEISRRRCTQCTTTGCTLKSKQFCGSIKNKQQTENNARVKVKNFYTLDNGVISVDKNKNKETSMKIYRPFVLNYLLRPY